MKTGKDIIIEVENFVHRLNVVMSEAAYLTRSTPSFDLAKDICSNGGKEARKLAEINTRKAISNRSNNTEEIENYISQWLQKFDKFINTFNQSDLKYLDYLSIAGGIDNYRFYIDTPARKKIMEGQTPTKKVEKQI